MDQKVRNVAVLLMNGVNIQVKRLGQCRDAFHAGSCRNNGECARLYSQWNDLCENGRH